MDNMPKSEAVKLAVELAGAVYNSAMPSRVNVGSIQAETIVSFIKTVADAILEYANN